MSAHDQTSHRLVQIMWKKWVSPVVFFARRCLQGLVNRFQTLFHTTNIADGSLGVRLESLQRGELRQGLQFFRIVIATISWYYTQH